MANYSHSIQWPKLSVINNHGGNHWADRRNGGAEERNCF